METPTPKARDGKKKRISGVGNIRTRHVVSIRKKKKEKKTRVNLNRFESVQQQWTQFQQQAGPANPKPHLRLVVASLWDFPPLLPPLLCFSLP